MTQRELTHVWRHVEGEADLLLAVNEAAHCLKCNFLSQIIFCLCQKVLFKKEGASKRRSVILFMFFSSGLFSIYR